MRRPVPRRGSLAAALAAALALPGLAAADRYVEVTSALDEGDAFDLHLSLDYSYTARSSAIKRELSGLPGTEPDDPMPLVRDLVFSGSRHELVPRLELGVFTDVWVSAALPVVLHQSADLSFDQRRDPCVFPGGSGEPTCINADNSTTVADGILPRTGFDADDPGGGFTDPSDPLIFRGVGRSGLDQVYLGLGWAPMNQGRDDTKPTWKIGAELRWAIGEEMDLDRTAPGSATGVGRGVHELHAWTSVAKRVGWAVPRFELWYRAPIGTTDDSLLREPEPRFGALSTSPQQRAGTRFGFEAVVWEDPARRQRVGLDFSTTFEAHFEGRAMSDMWEVFRYAGDANAGGVLALDADPVADGVQELSHPGATNIENYMTVAATLGARAELGDHARLGAHVSYYAEQSHLITFADAGDDLPTCTGGATSGCEVDSNGLVNEGTEEVNPLHAPLVDVAGHRYRVDEAHAWTVGVNAQFLF